MNDRCGVADLLAELGTVLERELSAVRQGEALPEEEIPGDADDRDWVNFSTYLPATVRRELRTRCALLDIELRQATAEAVTAWLAGHPPR